MRDTTIKAKQICTNENRKKTKTAKKKRNFVWKQKQRKKLKIANIINGSIKFVFVLSCYLYIKPL